MQVLLQSLDVVEQFLVDNPWSVLLVALVMRAGLAYQRQLTWYEYRTLHGVRRMLFPVLARVLPYDSFVNPKGGRDDAEYLDTRPESVRAVAKQLQSHNGSLHLLSSIKRRPAEHGDPLTRAHVVWTHADGNQTEAYLFANDDGTTDVYAHFEASVRRPIEHLTGGQTDGDARGVVKAALSKASADA